MTSEPRLPVLPHGSPTTLRGLSETFSFHSSPEAFITSRVLAFQASNPSLANSRVPIRAKVLNRNVAVVSSYHHVKQILCEEGKTSNFSAGKAYEELMAPFFPPPNLLLADPPAHQQIKEAWRAKIDPLSGEMGLNVQNVVTEYFRGFRSGSTIDLYESMKELSWRLILGTFTSASEEDAARLESLQEDLLRGQFSLFPISVNAKVWRSPRSKGLAARKELQELLKARVRSGVQGCPFVAHDDKEQDDVASHLLLFTSSLAIKSLASLLTAILLNLFIYNETGVDASNSIAAGVMSLANIADRLELLRSTILETERLSPPVVGIMRRTTQDVTLLSGQENIRDTLVPTAWDVWLYFVGAARDPAAFGDAADLFRPDRYYNASKTSNSPEQGLAFGMGPKSCLGEHLIREMAMTVAKTFLGVEFGTSDLKARVEIQGNVDDIPNGVQGWLGWQHNIRPEEWAKDMKQLPTQRPTNPVMVRLVHNLGTIPT